MRFDFLQQFNRQPYIFFTQWFFADGAGFVKWQIHEMQPIVGYSTIPPGGAGLTPADQPFDLLDLGTIHLSRFLVSQKFLDVLLYFRGMLGSGAEHALKFRGKIGEPQRIGIEHRDIAGGLIGDMHFVLLVDQPNQRAAHADHIVIRMRRKQQHALGEGAIGGTGNITGAFLVERFSTGPAVDGFVHLPEHVDVDFVRRAVRSGEILQPVFVVIFGREFEDGFVDQPCQPDDGLADDRLGPFDIAEQPGAFESRQFRRCGFIEHEAGIAMLLKIAGGNGRRDRPFNRPRNNGRLALAECDQNDALGRENRANPHRDGTAGDMLLPEKIRSRIQPRDPVERDQARTTLAG